MTKRNDDLHRGQELGVLGDEEHGDPEQGPDEAEGGVDGVLPGDHAEGTEETDERPGDEDRDLHQ